MNTFRTTRTLAATTEAIFAAITDPQRLARWWGPAGFNNRFSAFDFRPGGQWVFDMIGPDGTRYPNEARFAVIDANHRVVIDHLSAPRFQLTLTLTAVPGGTRIDWTQAFEDPAVAASLRSIVEPANEQNLDRLTAEVSGADRASSPT